MLRALQTTTKTIEAQIASTVVFFGFYGFFKT